MSLKSFFKSLKNVFWMGSVSENLERRSSSSTEDRDIFFIARDVVDYKDEIKDLKSWIKEEFEDPKISLNDPDSMEPYIELSLDVGTLEGNFRLVYYDNNELVLRGDRKITEDVEPEVANRLNLEFKRV